MNSMPLNHPCLTRHALLIGVATFFLGTSFLAHADATEERPDGPNSNPDQSAEADEDRHLTAPSSPGHMVEFNPPEAPKSKTMIALTGMQLVDGNGGQPISKATVLIHGSKIEAAGPAESIAIPADADILDLQGTTVVPGFVDCHFHSINDLRTPRRFLSNGVTSLRDPGHPFRFYQAVGQTDEPMPRVFLTGAHLDSYPPIWPQQAVLVGTEQQAKQAVLAHVERGATAIKTYFRLPLPLIRAACDTAKEKGLPVTAHLELVPAVDAIRAGLRGVEHVTSFGTSLADPVSRQRFESIVAENPKAREEWRYRLWSELNLDKSTKLASVLKVILEHEVVLSPTLAVFERRAKTEDSKGYEALGFQNMLDFVRRAHQAGATIVAGSHTWVPQADFGFAFQRELELLVECGLTPLEAITAGTREGAKFLQSEHRLGTIQPGMLADLLVVAGNPTQNISDLRKVQRVMLNGRWISDSSK